MIWYEPAEDGAEHLLVRSSATLAVASYLGGIWRVLGAMLRAVPRAVRDRAYDWIARHRHRFASETCVIPALAQRPRFLDLELSAPTPAFENGSKPEPPEES
jgi:predicted DCC family thiol-disulfide oxidoreductase YuxK